MQLKQILVDAIGKTRALNGLAQQRFGFFVHLNFDAVWQGLTTLREPKFPGCFEEPPSQHKIVMFEGTWEEHLD